MKSTTKIAALNARKRLRLGELLLDAGRITQKQLEDALAFQKKSGFRLGRSLTEVGAIGELELHRFLAKRLGIEYLDLGNIELDGERILQLTGKIFEGQYNTISSAYVILALGAYSALQSSGNYDEKIVFSAFDQAGQAQILHAAAQPFLTAPNGTQARRLQVKGETPMFYLNLQAGFDAQLPGAAMSEGIEIFRDFVDDDGNVVTQFEQGRELTVRLKVRALGEQRLNNIAIVDLLPGGFEVQRRSVTATARGWQADYIDIREDRVVYYGSFDRQLRELRYRVKLTSAGSFVIPPSYAESMYDRSIRAHTAPGRFEVSASQ